MGTRPVTVSPTQTACPTGNDLTADVGDERLALLAPRR